MRMERSENEVRSTSFGSHQQNRFSLFFTTGNLFFCFFLSKKAVCLLNKK